jgi:rRNA maturation endonuclease Nob1
MQNQEQENIHTAVKRLRESVDELSTKINTLAEKQLDKKQFYVVGNDIPADQLHYCEACDFHWSLDRKFIPKTRMYMNVCHNCKVWVKERVVRTDIGPTSYCEHCGDTAHMLRSNTLVNSKKKSRTLNRYTCPTCNEPAEQLIDPKEMEC